MRNWVEQTLFATLFLTVFLIVFHILFQLAYCETFEQCRDRLDTPQKIGYFIKHNISYCYNKEAVTYRTPEEVFRSRTGGCTDKANFAYELLTYHGYTAGIYEMWNETHGHSFTVYINNEGNYSAIDSIFGQVSWNRKMIRTIANLIYMDYGGVTGIRFVKGYKDWDLRN